MNFVFQMQHLASNLLPHGHKVIVWHRGTIHGNAINLPQRLWLVVVPEIMSSGGSSLHIKFCYILLSTQQSCTKSPLKSKVSNIKSSLKDV